MKRRVRGRQIGSLTGVMSAAESTPPSVAESRSFGLDRAGGGPPGPVAGERMLGSRAERVEEGFDMLIEALVGRMWGWWEDEFIRVYIYKTRRNKGTHAQYARNGLNGSRLREAPNEAPNLPR